MPPDSCGASDYSHPNPDFDCIRRRHKEPDRFSQSVSRDRTYLVLLFDCYLCGAQPYRHLYLHTYIYLHFNTPRLSRSNCLLLLSVLSCAPRATGCPNHRTRTEEQAAATAAPHKNHTHAIQSPLLHQLNYIQSPRYYYYYY